MNRNVVIAGWLVKIISLISKRISPETSLSEKICNKKHIGLYDFLAHIQRSQFRVSLGPGLPTVTGDTLLPTLFSPYPESQNLLSSLFFTMGIFKHINHKSHGSQKKRASFSSLNRSPRGASAWSTGPCLWQGQLCANHMDGAELLCSWESWFPKGRGVGR